MVKIVLNGLKIAKTLFFVSSSILVLWLVVKIFLFEIFYVPTASMEKTIMSENLILVSKFSYGVRLRPETNWNLPRIGSLKNIQQNDIVVFNCQFGFETNTDKNKQIWEFPAFVKRCAALPSDTFKIVNTIPYINNVAYKYANRSNNRMPYNTIDTKNDSLNNENSTVFKTTFLPNTQNFKWNDRNFGPIIVPKKGVTITIDSVTISIYKRVIELYEHNLLTIDKRGVYINSVKSKTYTFKMNYYIMLGDNSNESYDSRYWGFVPDNHIIGKAIAIIYPNFSWL